MKSRQLGKKKIALQMAGRALFKTTQA